MYFSTCGRFNEDEPDKRTLLLAPKSTLSSVGGCKMVSPWVVAGEEQPQPQTVLHNLSTAESAILPRPRTVYFQKTDRFPQRNGTTAAPVSVLRNPPVPRVPTIKFGVALQPKPPIEDAREPMTILGAERCFDAVQMSSPRFTMGSALTAAIGPSSQGPGPGTYDVERSSNAASPTRPQGRFRGKGIAPFASTKTNPRVHSKDMRAMPGPGYYEPENYDGGLLKKSFNVLEGRPVNSEKTNISIPVSPMRCRSTRSADSPLQVSRAQSRKIKVLVEAASFIPKKTASDDCDDIYAPQTSAWSNNESVGPRSRRASQAAQCSADDGAKAVPPNSRTITSRIPNNDTTTAKNKLSRCDMRKMLTYLHEVS